MLIVGLLTELLMG